MRVLIVRHKNDIPIEMEYAGTPAKGHQLFIGVSTVTVTKVEKLETENDNDPKFKVFIDSIEDNEEPSVSPEESVEADEDDDVDAFLAENGKMIETVGLREFLERFYNYLDKHGKIAH